MSKFFSKFLGVEWVNKYDWLPSLSFEHADAGGFYDELVSNDGWVGSFNWGDGNAFEDDFKRNDKDGNAPDWVDAQDFVYFTGHGSPWGFYFRQDVPDDSMIEADNYSGADQGDLRLGKHNLEWLALEVCETLKWEDVLDGHTYDVFDRWCGAFQGMHIMCSFTTVSDDLETPGRYFAACLDGRWMWEIFHLLLGFSLPLRVIDSWFVMTSLCQPDVYESAVLYADTEGTNTGEDFIHGHGYVSPDPVPGAANWFMWTWLPHQC